MDNLSRAGQADPGRTPSDQPRTRGQECRQRPGAEPRRIPLRHDQRGRSSAHAGASLPGLQIKQAWQAIDQLDTAWKKSSITPFSPDLGYLTACPTNLGTGIRVSAMLHLPGLVLAEQINPIIQSVNKLGLAVRGLYGEGTEALGNVFQVSNQMTLGETERESSSA